MMKRTLVSRLQTLCIAALCCSVMGATRRIPQFRVVAFFTGKEDAAHISFLREAERWFPEIAKKYDFEYDTTSNWRNLNSEFLSAYQVVVFLDTRPEQEHWQLIDGVAMMMPPPTLRHQAVARNLGFELNFHFRSSGLAFRYPRSKSLLRAIRI